MKIRLKASNKWQKIFAWLPVITEEGNLVWLENVYEKIEYACIPNVYPSSWNIYTQEVPFPDRELQNSEAKKVRE